VSILHRISGALLFLVGIPAAAVGVQASLESPETFAHVRRWRRIPSRSSWVSALAWAYLHHLLAGVRHLVRDLHVGTRSPVARALRGDRLVLALLLTLIVAVRLW
jgi:succinate dehydrogenase / fumarate reductase cytochrome b subunit